MRRTYFVVDAFATERFTGNPAAVVLDADGLDDGAMQRIAAEFNLSETTFVLPPARRPIDDPLTHPSSRKGERSLSTPPGEESQTGQFQRVRFRWFTPTVEVGMCGHATLAGLRAMLEAGRTQLGGGEAGCTIQIETRSGELTGFIESVPDQPGREMFWIELIPPTLTPVRLDADAFAAALRSPPDAFDPEIPSVRTQDDDLLLFVRSVETLNNARPDFPLLTNLLEHETCRGLCLATAHTITPFVQVQSRFFAPTAGVDEDPVTGSVHGPLTAYLVERGYGTLHDGVAALTCAQAKAGGRGGLLHALVSRRADDSLSVRIGGKAVVTMRGTLEL